MTDIHVHVANVIGKIDLGSPVNILRVHSCIADSVHVDKDNSALRIYIDADVDEDGNRLCVIVFDTGIMSLGGARSVAHCESELRNILPTIAAAAELPIDPILERWDFQPVCITIMCHFMHRVNLDNVVANMPRAEHLRRGKAVMCTLHPGAIIIYGGGFVVGTGFTNEEAAVNVIHEVYEGLLDSGCIDVDSELDIDVNEGSWELTPNTNIGLLSETNTANEFSSDVAELALSFATDWGLPHID